MSEKFQIVFFGTPDFAVPSLRKLFHCAYKIPLVVSQPDRPKGRGRKLQFTPVKEAALELGLDVYQPKSVNSESFLKIMTDLSPDLFVVAAFGQIFSEKLLNIPKKGAINVHASLLPKYRGPAPIQWALINGEKETGITTMLMEKQMDAGDILLSSVISVRKDDTAGTLHDRLAGLGAKTLEDTLRKLENNDIQPTPQDHSKATYAPMLKKEDSRIDWNQPAEKLQFFIRAMSPRPGAFTFHGNSRLKIFEAMQAPGEKNATPGTVLNAFENEIRVASAQGEALAILEIQGESGKRMKIKDFLCGHSIPPGSVFS